MAESRLFKPLKIGNIEVNHRIAMAPLTRLRNTSEYVPVPLMKEYYGQRASIPGTLLISEGTFISASSSGGFAKAPGIWSAEQIAAWRTITDEVHSKGSFIVNQIAGTGRQVFPGLGDTGLEVVGPSAIPFEKGAPVPRPMTVQEIQETIQDFAAAAKNAISAGFDGVELHAANGFLIDQFIQDVSNQRTDGYGGSVENRSRFAYEVMKAVADAVGPERVGIRLSPWSPAAGMKMDDPIPQFTDVIRKAAQLNIAYIHMIESRVIGPEDVIDDKSGVERLDFAYKAWNGPILVAGGNTPAGARKLVDEEYPDKDIVVIFGRHFISNPDLVYRIKESIELNHYDRSTFYSNAAEGYTDYPFSPQYLASQSA